MVEIVARKSVVKDTPIHFVESTNHELEHVIFLHGMKFNASTWQKLGTLQKVADNGFHAMAIDMPGFGQSPASSQQQDELLKNFITDKGLHKPVLVGPSMGGRIALEFVLDNQELIGALILIGCVGVEENRERLDKIKIPTLIVWGSDDQISSPVNSDLLHESIIGSQKVIVEGASHPCYLDQPAVWHAVLLEFLQGK